MTVTLLFRIGHTVAADRGIQSQQWGDTLWAHPKPWVRRHCCMFNHSLAWFCQNNPSYQKYFSLQGLFTSFKAEAVWQKGVREDPNLSWSWAGMAISNLTMPQLNMSGDHEHQGKQASKNRPQHALSSAEFMFISVSALQVLWHVGGSCTQSLSRESDLVLLKLHSWCQHWTQHNLPMTEARVTNQELYPLENKTSFKEKIIWVLFADFF